MLVMTAMRDAEASGPEPADPGAAAWSIGGGRSPQADAQAPPAGQRGRGGRGGGGPIVLNPDDVAAFPEPADNITAARDGIARGRLEMIEYDSKTVGTRRKMNVYTPPGYTTGGKYPVLYLLHGIGGDETEWQRFATPDVMLDNLIADGRATPMIIVMPNGARSRTTGLKEATSWPRPRHSQRSSATSWTTSSRRSSRATRRRRSAKIGRLRACRWVEDRR
jgi:hypothetical protein